MMEKTNITSANKFNCNSYPKVGEMFENTDDCGMVEIMFPIRHKAFVFNIPFEEFRSIKEAILNDQLEGLNPSPIIPLEKENTVTEDFALKLVAVVANKEKIKDL